MNEEEIEQKYREKESMLYLGVKLSSALTFVSIAPIIIGLAMYSIGSNVKEELKERRAIESLESLRYKLENQAELDENLCLDVSRSINETISQKENRLKELDELIEPIFPSNNLFTYGIGCLAAGFTGISYFCVRDHKNRKRRDDELENLEETTK